MNAVSCRHNYFNLNFLLLLNLLLLLLLLLLALLLLALVVAFMSPQLLGLSSAVTLLDI
jgi:hypothetical protein